MTDALWTAEDARAATGGEVTHPWAATGISIDSRSTVPGDLFVALRGPRFDGHDYVDAAMRAGAAAAMVSTAAAARAAAQGPMLVVDDPLRGLERLAASARARARARVIAVTGSAGKTGTKEALRAMLAESGATHTSAASHNNHWGVPLSVAALPAAADFGVFEIGMNRAGEIANLSRLARPQVAVVTTVEAAHLEFFSSVEKIAEAKAEIFAGIEAGGVAVLNRDNQHFDVLAAAAHGAGADVIGFGAHVDAQVRLHKHALLDDCSTVSAEVCGERVAYKVGVPGRHWVLNSLAALAAVWAAGADLGLAALALGRFEAGPGRGRRVQVETRDGTFLLVDDSYNANPASMRAALKVLGASETGVRGRRIAVLGDMRELGVESPALHAELAEVAEEADVDLVLTVGTEAEALHGALDGARRGAHWDTAADAARELVRIVRPGDVVLVKGSQAAGMAAVVQALASLSERGAA